MSRSTLSVISLLLLALSVGVVFAKTTPKKPVAAKAKAKPKPTTTKPKPKPTQKPKPKPTPKPTAKPKPRPIFIPKPPNTSPTMAPTPVVAPIETGPKTWALLVGISHYQTDQISSLRFPAKDAMGLRDALIDPTVGGLPPKQVMLLADDDATRDKINGAVGTFLRPNVKNGDKVVVFLAGHGIAKGVGLSAKSYLLPTDVKGLTSAALDSSAVSLRALADDLATLPASQFVLFVDACREDPTPGRGVKGNSLSDVLARGISVVPQKPNVQSATFFACSIGQRAFEDEKYGHGVFTNWIMQGLRAGAVAQKADGSVDLGCLSSYVGDKVNDWAKARSAAGFEVSQTPELVSAQLSSPLVLLRVKRAVVDSPIAPSAPRVFVAASPDSALISINGTRAGVGSVEKTLSAEGDVSVSVSAPGYAPVARTVKALGGYEQQIEVQLQPSGGGMGSTSAANEQASDFYRRALEAQSREQYEIAEQGLIAAIGSDPKFGAAHEALFDLHRMQGRNLDALSDAIGMVNSTARNAHAMSFLSRAYYEYALKGSGEANSTTKVPALDSYRQPKKVSDGVKLALKAANEAVSLDANSPEANRALGYALAALDEKGKNKRAALAAWGKAGFLDTSDADNYLGLGYGIRYYAVQLKDADDKRNELLRAIGTLNEAARLRPNFYEAHRELAFCFIALGDNPNALRECKLARSNRGGASDPDEIAGVEVAMSGLHEQIAQTSTGTKKTDNEAASQGYLTDAKETSTSPDLKKAIAILNTAGVSTSLRSYLPTQLQPLLNIRGVAEDKLNGLIPNLGRIHF
ncbi:hypothetical protein IAD21_06143 [Abditibacteriota bacterium]|nr:hypothetical protein IAD21_06143 [Abditibacteriota bacterium]